VIERDRSQRQDVYLMHFVQLPVGPGRGMPAGRGMGMMPPGTFHGDLKHPCY